MTENKINISHENQLQPEGQIPQMLYYPRNEEQRIRQTSQRKAVVLLANRG